MRKFPKTDDDRVKENLVQLISRAMDKSDFYHAALLANAYTKLRAVELKQDEGNYGDDLLMPAQSNDAAQVRS